MNLTLAGEHTKWFKRDAVKIESGDIVGVLSFKHLEKSEEYINDRVLGIIVNDLISNGDSKISCKRCSTIVQAKEGLWANKSLTDIQKRIESMLARGAKHNEYTLRLLKEDGTMHVVMS